MSLADRFEKKVVRGSGCWKWTGSKDQRGYGRIAMETTTGYRPVPASRAAYLLYVGPIPDGLDVCHRCDNPECTNPEHLFVATAKENTADMVRKGRCRAGWQNAQKTHCKAGHEFTVANTYWDQGGHRHCRRCSVNAQRRHLGKPIGLPYHAVNKNKTHCKSGHAFDEANTYVCLPTPDRPRGRRMCRECMITRARAAYALKKEVKQ